ncbi:MAG: copper transporter [Actinobacteria bacterium]|nr:copper transporter [Actinomycetota bacterium]
MVVLGEAGDLLIDFRYHLVSIIAVFLALGLGILMGTAVLNDALVESLKKDIQTLGDRVDARQAEIEQLDRRVAAADAFANEAASWLTADALQGRVIVLVQIEGTDGDMVGAVSDAIVDAGGEIQTTIVVGEKFALQDQIERDQLALAIDSSASSVMDLRLDAGALLGARLAAAAAEAPTSARPQDVAQERLRETLRGLEENEFISVLAPEDQSIIPSNATFLIVGGSTGDRNFDSTGFVASLAAALSSRGAPTLVAEPAESTWGLVPAVREDPEAGTRVATVDQANTVEGRVAVVLGLQRAFEGVTDHYGVGPGATQVIPEPAPSP